MPALRDPRHEAFAQARAKGALLIDAYESAGFVRHRGHPSRLALKREVADRIALLRFLQTEMDDVSPQGLLASLRRIIKAGESSENPALVNAARLAIVDASRIQGELARQQAVDRSDIDKEFNSFLASEAVAAAPEAGSGAPFAAPRSAPQRPSAPRQRPSGSPPAPRGLLASAPRDPHDLLTSAAARPLALPGFPQAATARALGARPGPTLDETLARVSALANHRHPAPSMGTTGI